MKSDEAGCLGAVGVICVGLGVLISLLWGFAMLVVSVGVWVIPAVFLVIGAAFILAYWAAE